MQCSYCHRELHRPLDAYGTPPLCQRCFLAGKSATPMQERLAFNEEMQMMFELDVKESERTGIPLGAEKE